MKNKALPTSVLNKSTPPLVFSKSYIDEVGSPCTIKAFVRFNDECGNGHNSFGITGEIRCRGRVESCGMLHEDIAKHFPELRKYLKWHLTSTDGPMHYIANTVYWAEQGNFDNARSCAVWSEASDKVFTLTPVEVSGADRIIDREDLKKALTVRLPGLMLEFKDAMEELGFTY